MRLQLRTYLAALGILATSGWMPLPAQQIQDTAAVRLALSATTSWLAIADAGKAGETWEAGAPAESVPDSPPGPYIVVQYLTRAASNRDVIETVTSMRTPDGTWKVAGYIVRANR